MATNSILPFGTTAGTELTDAEYAADAQRLTGHQPGIARERLANKQAHQASVMASGLAQFIADNQATNVTDALTPAQISTMLGAASFGRLLGVRVMTSSGTHNFNAATKTAIIEGIGGGGGGGGCPAVPGGQQGTAPGGTSGTSGRVLVASPPASASATIGAAGAGGTVGGTGGTGGNTSIGTLATFPGGGGGGAAVPSSGVVGLVAIQTSAAVPTTSGTLLNYQSGRSKSGQVILGTTVGLQIGGDGGDSQYGAGGAGGVGLPGGSAGGHGSGGGGASQYGGTAGATGGAGAPGMLIIWEFA